MTLMELMAHQVPLTSAIGCEFNLAAASGELTPSNESRASFLIIALRTTVPALLCLNSVCSLV